MQLLVLNNRNWAIDAESKAKDWRWQPTAWAGMKVTF